MENFLDKLKLMYAAIVQAAASEGELTCGSKEAIGTLGWVRYRNGSRQWVTLRCWAFV